MKIKLTFLISFLSFIFLFFTNSGISSSERLNYQESYNLSDFSSCSKKLYKIAEARKLSDIENLIFAECLFQIKQYRKSAFYFSVVLEKDPKNSLRAARRLLDIYNIGDSHFPLQKFIDFLLNHNNSAAISRQIQKTLITRNQIPFFLPLYQKYPIQLNDQQFNTVAAAVKPDVFEKIIKVNSSFDRKKEVIWAKYWITHNDNKKAVALLDNLLKESIDKEALLLKAGIYWNNDSKAKAIETLEDLKTMGIFGYVSIADFYFENADLRLALSTVREAIKKGYSLHEREILYEMSLQNFEHTAYLLEKYLDEKKISIYRYQSLSREYFSQATRSEYWKGIKLYEKEKPQICLKALSEQLPWDSPENINAEISLCKEIKKYENHKNFLFQADALKRFDVLSTILKNKKKLTDTEKYLQAKASYYHDPRLNIALEIFNSILLTKEFAYHNEVSYYKASIYLKTSRYEQAEKILESLNYKDSGLLYFNSLLYQDKWDELESSLNSSAGYKTGFEKVYFQAIWSLGKNQIRQSKELLESYLERSGQFGNKAVYLLFLLKYFQESPPLKELCLNLAKYSHGLNDENWKFTAGLKLNEESSEIEVFSHYWHARYLIVSKQNNRGYDILEKLKEHKNAKLLQSEIQYILLTRKKTNIDKNKSLDYLMEFPASPFRVFIKP